METRNDGIVSVRGHFSIDVRKEAYLSLIYKFTF